MNRRELLESLRHALGAAETCADDIGSTLDDYDEAVEEYRARARMFREHPETKAILMEATFILKEDPIAHMQKKLINFPVPDYVLEELVYDVLCLRAFAQANNADPHIHYAVCQEWVRQEEFVQLHVDIDFVAALVTARDVPGGFRFWGWSLHPANSYPRTAADVAKAMEAAHLVRTGTHWILPERRVREHVAHWDTVSTTKP